MKFAVLSALAATVTAAPAPTVPPPRIDLEVVAPTTHGRWTVRVTNRSSVPVRILADLRLLSLDVTPRSSRTLHCELPEDMRPDDDLEARPLLVPPGRTYAESFDPRLFCFGESRLDAISPGAAVVAHLGWGKTGSTLPRLEVAPAPGGSATFAGMGRLDSPPIAIPDEPTAAPTPAAVRYSNAIQDADPEAPRLRLAGVRAVDAENPNYAEVPVTVENRGRHSVAVRFRPETLGFDLDGPNGSEHCVWPMPPAAATIEAFATLAPHQTATLSVLLASYCRGTGMAVPGLLFVRPWLETSQGSGRDVGMHAFEGIVIAERPTLVRLRHPVRDPVPSQAPEPEPELEPERADSPALRVIAQ